MATYSEMNKEDLQKELEVLKEEYAKICDADINLDMSRGKPGADQLKLSVKMLDILDADSDVKASNGIDCRNYGLLDGIPEAKKMMAGIMQTDPENIIIYGNSSLCSKIF